MQQSPLPSSPRRDTPEAIRSLLQSRILVRLFSGNVCAKTRMVLKGGLAMRVAHDSHRQTKDIDLDADHGMTTESARKAVRHAIQEATAGGWLEDVVVSEPKQTATTARWKIQGSLPDGGPVLHMTVEVSFRHDVAAGEVRQVQWSPDGVPPSAIPVYRDDVLVLNKIEALLSPNRDAPRDLVDLYLLFEAGAEIKPSALCECLRRMGRDPRGVETLVRDLWDRIEGMDEARYQNEVVPNWQPPMRIAAQGQPPSPWPDWTTLRLLVGARLDAEFRALLTGGTGTQKTPSETCHVDVCHP